LLRTCGGEKKEMTSTLTILVLALLIMGVATATMYALPIIQQAEAAQAQNGM